MILLAILLLHSCESGDVEPNEATTQDFAETAEESDGSEEFALGLRYAKGDGVAKDAGEAAKWYRKASDQGLAEAQSRLAFCYFVGRGVPADKPQAVKWWRKAAEQGDSVAQYYLGFCYSRGFGVVKDSVIAYKWANLAAASGHDIDASELRENLEKEMTSEQIATAQRLSREWQTRQTSDK